MTQEEAKKLIDKVNHRIKRIVDDLALSNTEKNQLTEYTIFDHFPIKAETNSGNISMSKEVIEEVQNNEDLQQKLEEFSTLSALKNQARKLLEKANVENVDESDVKIEAVSAITVKYWEAKSKEDEEYDWYEEVKQSINYIKANDMRDLKSVVALRPTLEKYNTVYNDMNHKGKKTYTQITNWVSKMKEIRNEIDKYHKENK